MSKKRPKAMYRRQIELYTLPRTFEYLTKGCHPRVGGEGWRVGPVGSVALVEFLCVVCRVYVKLPVFLILAVLATLAAVLKY